MLNSQELFDRFRIDIVDTSLPYLWTDEEVVSYADDAYRMYIRLTGGIPDFTSDVTKIPLVTGEDIVATDPSILRVMTATLASTGADIEVVNATDLPMLFQSSTDYGSLRTLSMKNVPGAVRWLVVGMEKYKAKVIQIPVVDDEIDMYVYRLPLVHITDGTHPLDDIMEDHHIHLLKWMKALAYQKQDAETFDKTKSAESEAAFRAYALQMKSEWERSKYKNRRVVYGGI